MTARLPAPVAVVRRDDSVALVRGDASDAVTLTAQGRWPAWRPGGDLLAVSRVERAGEAAKSSIGLLDLEGGEIATVFESPSGVAHVIAPRVPHYVCWSPRGDLLSYVAVGHEGLTLFHQTWPTTTPASRVTTGAPLFSAWDPAGRYQAIHAGSTLLVADVLERGTPRVLSEEATGFRAPAYSDHRRVLAYGRRAAEGLELVYSAPDGSAPGVVARFDSGIVFGFRPSTRELTIATTRDPARGVFDRLWSLSPSLERNLLHRGPFVAFSWSPRGERLLLVVPTQTGDGRYAAVALDPGGGVVGATEPFVPSDDFRSMLGFFDQFLQSHSIWAPDGSCALLTGRLPLDGPSASWGDPSGPYAWLWSAERGARLERLSPGSLALFPSAPRGTGTA